MRAPAGAEGGRAMNRVKLGGAALIAMFFAGMPVAADEDRSKPGQGVVAAPAALGGTPVVPVLPVLDDFDRPDGALGAPWTLQNGDLQVFGNRARGVSGASLATFGGAEGSVAATALVEDGAGTDTSYVALVLEHADLSNSLFFKVQRNGGPSVFDYAACYYGNNGSSWGLGFFALSAPFQSARMTVWVDENRDATIHFSEIDGGAGTQTYVCTAAPESGGAGTGIAGYQSGDTATLDDFGAGAGYVAPITQEIPTLGTLGFALLAAALALLSVYWLRGRHRAA